MPPFVCTIKALPPDVTLGAAHYAGLVNPANEALRPTPALVYRSPALWHALHPEHLALLSKKYWGNDGVHLTVSFLDAPSAELRRRILAHANAWGGDNANISFREVASGGDVRIRRTRGAGHWANMGTDIHLVPAGEPTMNLDGFEDSTPEEEMRRVVEHEFGHILGFAHEHERPEILALLDENKTIAFFERYYGWSAPETREQALTPWRASDLVATLPDTRSVMCYDFPGECTRSGQPIPGGQGINASDAALAARLYPRVPTAPVVGPDASAIACSLYLGRPVHPGTVCRFVAPVDLAAGPYDLLHGRSAQARPLAAALPEDTSRAPWPVLLHLAQEALRELGPLAAPFVRQMVEDWLGPPWLKVAVEELIDVALASPAQADTLPV
jgi:hypothetical protein